MVSAARACLAVVRTPPTTTSSCGAPVRSTPAVSASHEPKRFVVAPVATRLVRRFLDRLGACSHEAEAAEDPPRLMSGEVGPVEARDAGENLLRRIPPATDDDVVLPDRIREHSRDSFFDAFGIKLEDVAGDREA